MWSEKERFLLHYFDDMLVLVIGMADPETNSSMLTYW